MYLELCLCLCLSSDILSICPNVRTSGEVWDDNFVDIRILGTGICCLANQKFHLYPKKYNCGEGGLEGGSLGVNNLWTIE